VDKKIVLFSSILPPQAPEGDVKSGISEFLSSVGDVIGDGCNFTSPSGAWGGILFLFPAIYHPCGRG